jgi:RTX calcium-binding nonapeptide repeat (4 copies)
VYYPFWPRFFFVLVTDVAFDEGRGRRIHTQIEEELMKILKRIGMVTIIAAIVLGWVSTPGAFAEEFTVTRTDDPLTDACMPDDCSLREAVIEANNRGGHDTILLSKEVYSLTIPVPQNGDFGFAQVGDLDIYDDVTIKGPTGGGFNKATIDANGATTRDRVFEIHGSDTDVTNVTMRRLFITDGRAHPTGPDNNGDGRPDFAFGGGILIEGGAALSGSDVILDRNTAESMGQGGAILNDGDLRLVRAQIRFNDAPDGFSGGLQTNPGATTSLYDTEVQNNDSIFGGGLGAYGVTTIERSAIYLNHASLGGGMRAAGSGSLTTLTNVTLAHNEAADNGSTIQARNGPGFTLNNVTIAHNTADSNGDGTGNAAVFLQRDSLSTSATLRNTILAANEDGSPGTTDVPDCEVAEGAAITLAGYDRLGNHHGCTFGVTPGAEGNQIGSSTNPIDPMLEIGINPNGGPTSTLALRAGSPAINAGNPAAPGSGAEACAASDQRGVPRLDCDIGAYELVRCQGAVVNIVGTPGPDVLRSDDRSDAILGLGGADEVFGGGGADAICAGEGKDMLRGQTGNNQIAGGPGNDTAYGGDDEDRLLGQDGNDVLSTRDGVQGNDLANGGAGTDTCRTDPGDKKVSCS